MNRKVTATSTIEGSTNEKLFTIAKFHETRLGRIEQYLSSVQNSFGKDTGKNARLDTLEEKLNIAFDSLQNLAKKVKKNVGTDPLKLAELETKIDNMGSTGLNTTKLAVMNEQLRLLAEKVEELEGALQNNEEKDDEEGVGDESSAE